LFVRSIIRYIKKLEKEFEIQITEKDIDNECLFTVEAMINMIMGKKLIHEQMQE